MTERIVLTDEQCEAVATAAWDWPTHPIDQQGLMESVREVVDAINKVRLGDPVGTIRRSETGVYAFRAHSADVEHVWRLIDCANGNVTWSDDCDWPVLVEIA